MCDRANYLLRRKKTSLEIAIGFWNIIKGSIHYTADHHSLLHSSRVCRNHGALNDKLLTLSVSAGAARACRLGSTPSFHVFPLFIYCILCNAYHCHPRLLLTCHQCERQSSHQIWILQHCTLILGGNSGRAPECKAIQTGFHWDR